ncbi:MAG: hypothetical protein WB780_17210 [Candidatus Acidiferrales bacterium]
MNTNRSGASGRRLFSFVAALFVFLLAGGGLRAQSSPTLDRLSSDTIFYIHWRGKTFAKGAQEKNHLLQLLQDPDFAPLRDALLKTWQGGGGKDGAPPGLSFTEYQSLLENDATFGVALNPASRMTEPAKNPSSVGAFLVYDVTGKSALLDKLEALKAANEKFKPIVKSYDFRGTSIEIRTTASNTAYIARTAKYYFYSDQKPLIEDLIARFQVTDKPESSVTQLPEYKAIRPYIGPDATLEYFVRMPDLAKLIPADKQDTPGAHFAQNLHLEKLHVTGAGISFSGEATRLRGAVLGDTSSPSLFDIAGASAATFVTLPAVNPGPPFHIIRLDLPAMYQLLRAAAMASLAPQQTAYIATGETMAQAFLGMSIDDALHLFAGEFATESVYAEDGSSVRIFSVSVQKPQDVLRIMHATIGKYIAGEDTAGDTTFLDISYPLRDPITGLEKPNHYHVAVTPHMILVAPRRAMLRAALERYNAKSGTASPADPFSNADLKLMRALLPEKLSGISAADLSNFPWENFFAQITQQVNEDAKGSKEPSSQATDWQSLTKPEAFARHLHAGISGWWKDSNGIYFDSYLQ